MKKVLILKSTNDSSELKPRIGTQDLEGYEYFFNFSRQSGVEMAMAYFKDLNFENRTIINLWSYENNLWQNSGEVKNVSDFDLIMDKIGVNPQSRIEGYRANLIKLPIPLISGGHLASFFTNKFNQYLLFPDLMPRTVLIQTKKDLRTKVQELYGEFIVIKKLEGCGGNGVYKVSKEEVLSCSRLKIDFPFVAQELIPQSVDSTGTGEKLNLQASDLRVVQYETNLLYALSRTASKDNPFYTNISLGGDLIKVDLKNIPTRVLEYLKKINTRFVSHFRRNILAIDFMFDSKKNPYLIEINTRPGFVFFHKGAEISQQEDYFNKVILENLK